ncbi:MAG: CAAX prenyl protease-related protein [Verrucomicrobiales bacterium]|nr:CAAX prenyl protease-related protein [Verrucomicrobiales bacterium]
MIAYLEDVKKSPVLARVVPFVVFLILTSAQGWFGEGGRYWIYLAKTLVGAWLLWELRGVLPEMKWAFSTEAVVVGVLVCVMWVGLDPYYPGQDQLMYKIGLGKNPAENPPKDWNPFVQFAGGTAMAWFFVAVRLLGSSLVVPPLEEIFYRSFLYRYLISPEFERVSLAQRHFTSLGLTCLIFAFTHQQWLAGILCGIAYQWLVWRKNRIGDAMTAHAITNFLLGLWIVARGDWKFW